MALAVLCAGIFLAAVDQTVVVTVLPSIIDDLEGGFSSAAVERAGWIVSSYLFGYTVVLPLMGRVADRFGHRRTYIISADLLVTGFGFGMVIAPISLFAVNAVKKSMMASGSAVLTASRLIGMTVGLAAINSWGISEFRSLTSDLPAPIPRIGLSFAGYVDELRLWEHKNVEVILGVLGDLFLIAAVVCVVAVVPSLFLLKKESGAEQ